MTKKAVLVFVPMPGMGHFLSMVNLAKLLMDLNSNLSTAVLFTNLPWGSTLNAEVDAIIASPASARIKFINFPFPVFDMADFVNQLANLGQAYKPSIVEAVTNDIVGDSASPQLAGFVVDMFFASLSNDFANEFNVPTYLYYTSSAVDIGLKLYLQTLYDEQKPKLDELQNSEIEVKIPLFANPVSTKFFHTDILRPATFESLHYKMAKTFREVKGIMVNTFSELQPHSLASLSDGKTPPIYPVGPILNLKSSSVEDKRCVDIIEWLDGQPSSSVVFLCFGSMGCFDEDQVKEIACGLEQSGHRFLWSLRRAPPKETMYLGPTDYEDVASVLPEGFLDRTRGIGKIVGWAPQVAILGHPAIGGFVSHCGWNSILESVWFGVPIAAWPIYAEQPMNAFEIVKELGIAVEIILDYKKPIYPSDKDDEEPPIVNATKIERGIKCLMEQDSDVRRRVKEMSDKSRKVLMEGGSSYSNLCRFINDVMDNMPRKGN